MFETIPEILRHRPKQARLRVGGLRQKPTDQDLKFSVRAQGLGQKVQDSKLLLQGFKFRI